MSNPTNTPTVTAAVVDTARRSSRLTVPLTDLQVVVIEATARRLGWSKATLARDAVFKFCAAIEANAALQDPANPLVSFVPLDERARR
jgi:hypothetical protein